MKPLLLFGSGGHSRPVVATLKALNRWDLIGIIDINYQGQVEEILGVNVLGSDELLKNFKPDDTSIFLAIGKNDVRKKIFTKLTGQGYEFPNIIHPKALVDPSAEIDFGNFVGPFSQIGPSVKIENANIINSYSNIEHETKIGSFCQIAPGAIICGRSELGDQILVGANATIIEKKIIASHTTIGAGSVITKSIFEKNQTIVGVPGKPQ